MQKLNKYVVVGLGNPGEEYKESRHNTGRMTVAYFDTKNNSKKVKVLVPDTFMNHSGKFVVKFIKTQKAAKSLVVVYDDLDLALGTFKISYNKSSGGHRGVESIIKSLKTQEFIRIRIGVAPTTPSGKLKKPQGEKAVLDFILGEFKPKETEILKKVFKKVSEAIVCIVEEGRERAMNVYN